MELVYHAPQVRVGQYIFLLIIAAVVTVAFVFVLDIMLVMASGNLIA